MAAISARYFRLLCSQAQADYFRVGEIEVREYPGGPNLCTGGTAFAGSSYQPASGAFDGVDGGLDKVMWIGNPAAENFIGYDFGINVAINHVTVVNGTWATEQNAFSFSIQYSTDNVWWTTLLSVPYTERPTLTGGYHYEYTITGFTLSGTVADDTGSPCARTVYAYQRDTGALLGSDVSDAVTGAWSISVPNTECICVCLDDSSGATYNDIIYRATPV